MDANPGFMTFFDGKRISLSNTSMFAVLEGVDASSRTLFMTDLSKADDKIECSFSAIKGQMDLSFKFLQEWQEGFCNCDEKCR